MQPLDVNIIACGIGYASDLGWWAIQLAINSTDGPYMNSEQLQNHSKLHASICFPYQDTMDCFKQLKFVFVNIYNSVWKLGFVNCTHTYSHTVVVT